MIENGQFVRYLRDRSHRDRRTWGNLVGHFLTNQAQCTVSAPQHRSLSRNQDQKDNTENFQTEALTCPPNRVNSKQFENKPELPAKTIGKRSTLASVSINVLSAPLLPDRTPWRNVFAMYVARPDSSPFGNHPSPRSHLSLTGIAPIQRERRMPGAQAFRKRPV